MKMLTRIVRQLAGALIIVMLLSGARGLPKPVQTECERGTGWGVNSELSSSQSNGTQNMSSHTVQTSSRGEGMTDDQTNNKHADGSSHDHESITYNDPTGSGCGNDGVPQSWSSSTDTDTDPEGNTKQHHEEIINKNGKCEKTTRDWEWDKHGKLIKDTGWVTTEVQCSKWNLQVKFEWTITSARTTTTLGPKTVLIPLEGDGDTYKGSYSGTFDYKDTGWCNGVGSIPTSFDVTAKENKFGDQDELDFSIKRLTTLVRSGTCEGGLHYSDNGPFLAITSLTFTLPAEDGAYWTEPEPVSVCTFTLKKAGP